MRFSSHQFVQGNTFGRACAKLRKTMGLTQRELGRLLAISEQTIQRWELGSRSPTLKHLKHLLALCVQRHAFAPGQECEDAEYLWLATHQKVAFDTAWVQSLLVELPVSEVCDASQTRWATATYLDWGDAPDVYDFYGREREQWHLEQWAMRE